VSINNIDSTETIPHVLSSASILITGTLLLSEEICQKQSILKEDQSKAHFLYRNHPSLHDRFDERTNKAEVVCGTVDGRVLSAHKFDTLGSDSIATGTSFPFSFVPVIVSFSSPSLPMCVRGLGGIACLCGCEGEGIIWGCSEEDKDRSCVDVMNSDGRIGYRAMTDDVISESKHSHSNFIKFSVSGGIVTAAEWHPYGLPLICFALSSGEVLIVDVASVISETRESERKGYEDVIVDVADHAIFRKKLSDRDPIICVSWRNKKHQGDWNELAVGCYSNVHLIRIHSYSLYQYVKMDWEKLVQTLVESS
ncbi:hypothetical protein ADUPG1_000691, partial [Aduncisulcus paluster]